MLKIIVYFTLLFQFLWIVPLLFLIVTAFGDFKTSITILIIWAVADYMWSTKFYPGVSGLASIIFSIPFFALTKTPGKILSLILSSFTVIVHILLSWCAYHEVLKLCTDVLFDGSFWSKISSFLIAYSFGVSGVRQMAATEAQSEYISAGIILGNFLPFAFIILLISNLLNPELSIYFQFLILIIFGLIPTVIFTGREIYNDKYLKGNNE